jgi:hypothetical protein
MKQTEKEMGVEGITTLLPLYVMEMVRKIVDISIEQALLLDEVEKHEAMKQIRGVFLALCIHRHARERASEEGTFALETVIEPSGNMLNTG